MSDPNGPNWNSAGMQLINGFIFGSGLILAAALFKAVLHMGFCG